MNDDWLDSTGALLGPGCPLPLDRPFTSAQALGWGVSRRAFGSLLQRGFVRTLLRGVYVAAQAPDDMLLRASALALVVPEHGVVAGRTAGWLHGVPVLPRSALHTPPPVDVVSFAGSRTRRPSVDGRRWGLEPRDIEIVRGIRVTTGLRTALDLGRLLYRYDALAALDGFNRIGVPVESMRAESARFRGYRGVRRTLRPLLPLVDGRAQSGPESALRLCWHDAGLPWPEPQLRVDREGGSYYLLDIGLRARRFGAEYDGVEFHTSPEAVRADEDRRGWLRDERWTIEVFTKQAIYHPHADAEARLARAYAEAGRALSRWTARGA